MNSDQRVIWMCWQYCKPNIAEWPLSAITAATATVASVAVGIHFLTHT